MNSKRVTNLFIPISPKRFWMKKLESFEPCMIEQIFSDEEDLLEFSLPAGLADAAKLNGDYKKIVSMLGVANYDNDKALLMTKPNIDDASRKHALEVEVIERLGEVSYLDPDMCKNNDNGDNQVDPLQLEALLLWRSTKLPLASISCKIGVDVEFVKQTVKKYKRLVKKQLRYNTANANKKRSIIIDAKIQEIREFWMRNRNRPLRLADIRKGVWKSDDDSQNPCYFTLSNV